MKSRQGIGSENRSLELHRIGTVVFEAASAPEEQERRKGEQKEYSENS